MATFREFDSRPSRVLGESSWRRVEQGFHLLLEKVLVVVEHSILPTVLDDNHSRMNSQEEEVVGSILDPWAKRLVDN